jgi:hypothetical protein
VEEDELTRAGARSRPAATCGPLPRCSYRVLIDHSLLLASPGAAVKLELAKGGAMCLACPEEPAPGQAQLRWSVDPMILTALDLSVSRPFTRRTGEPIRGRRYRPFVEPSTAVNLPALLHGRWQRIRMLG